MKDYEESQKPQRLKRLSEEDFFSDQFLCKAIDLESAVATGMRVCMRKSVCDFIMLIGSAHHAINNIDHDSLTLAR